MLLAARTTTCSQRPNHHAAAGKPTHRRRSATAHVDTPTDAPSDGATVGHVVRAQHEGAVPLVDRVLHRVGPGRRGGRRRPTTAGQGDRGAARRSRETQRPLRRRARRARGMDGGDPGIRTRRRRHLGRRPDPRTTIGTRHLPRPGRGPAARTATRRSDHEQRRAVRHKIDPDRLTRCLVRPRPAGSRRLDRDAHASRGRRVARRGGRRRRAGHLPARDAPRRLRAADARRPPASARRRTRSRTGFLAAAGATARARCRSTTQRSPTGASGSTWECPCRRTRVAICSATSPTRASTSASPAHAGYQTRVRLPYHTDSSDTVGLLCLQPSKSGGLSSVVSSTTVFNETIRRRPDLAHLWFKDWYYDRRNEERPGEAPFFTSPLACWHEGLLSMRYIRGFLDSAQRHDAVPRRTDDEAAFLDLVDEISTEDGVALHMDFRPGDIQFLCNYSTLHSRTEYEDWPEPERKRHLLRLWISLDDGRPLPEAASVAASPPAWQAAEGSRRARAGRPARRHRHLTVRSMTLTDHDVAALCAARFATADIERPTRHCGARHAGRSRRCSTHRTCRRFTDRPVDDELIELLLAATFSTPSKSDLQQCSVIVVDDPASRSAIAELIPSMPWVADAPRFFVFCGDSRRIRRVADAGGVEFGNDHLDAFLNAAADAAMHLSTFVLGGGVGRPRNVPDQRGAQPHRRGVGDPRRCPITSSRSRGCASAGLSARSVCRRGLPLVGHRPPRSLRRHRRTRADRRLRPAPSRRATERRCLVGCQGDDGVATRAGAARPLPSRARVPPRLIRVRGRAACARMATVRELVMYRGAPAGLTRWAPEGGHDERAR